VDIAFEDINLQRSWASAQDLRRILDPECERRLRAHLKSLLAAESLAEFRFLPGRCLELRRGRYALELVTGVRLIFRAASSSRGKAAADWAAVRSIVLIGIEDSR
jgi:hypothetical protein